MESIVGAIVGTIILAVVLTLILAWPVMVLLGVFASMTGYSAFAIGFWPTVVGIFIVRLVIGGSTSSS